jgi:alkaline phosphatase D
MTKLARGGLNVNRRELLRAAGLIVGTGWAAALPGSKILAQARFASNPFTLGVASGDPLPDGVVLWTRLAPNPLGATGEGVPQELIEVAWVVASDERMTQVVQRGVAPAAPELAHSVHVEVAGLEANRVYFYQFTVGGFQSAVGRTKTAPAAGDAAQNLRFAFCSCSDWQNGYFTAYKAMAEDQLDVVFQLGDYIYEYGPDPKGVRQHNGAEIVTLEDYRRRYALYHTDANLQAAHASAPWVVTWDDHEVENNYAGDIPEDKQPVEPFKARRAAAYQAYYEHMPLRRSSLPRGTALQLYRRLNFGTLASFSILDTRQYRTDQPNDDGLKPRSAAVLDPNATLMGPAQERWLLEGLGASQARWNLIAQQVMMAQFDWQAGQGQVFNMDQWDGYLAARQRLLGYIATRKPSNPVVLTGDIHSSWVHDLKVDFDQPQSATVGTELITTSISADFPQNFIAPVTAALADNPHAKFFDGANRGYVRATMTPDKLTAEFQAVSSIKEPTATTRTLATFVVENGRAGAQRA